MYVPSIFLCSSLFIFSLLHTMSIQDVEYNIRWNSTTHNWLEFYRMYCGRVCKNGEVINVSKLACLRPSCFKCDCDPTCLIYGTCCPHINSTIDDDNQEINPDEDFKKLLSNNLPSPERFICEALPGNTIHYYMISDCSPDYIRRLEENQLQLNSDLSNSVADAQSIANITAQCQNPDTSKVVIPYSDLRYGITFKNKFCAICNGYQIENNDSEHLLNISTIDRENITVAWELHISCKHYQNIYHLTSEYQLYMTALQLQFDQCIVVYEPPSIQMSVRTCNPEFNTISESNCSSSDPLLQHVCLNSTEKYLRVEGGLNIFCYMCSVRELSTSKYCMRRSGIGISYDYISPTLLLSGRIFNVIRDDFKCKASNEWRNDKFNFTGYTFQGDCRPSVCSAGKLIEPDGLCKTALRQIRGLAYKLFIVFVPKSLNKCVSKDDFRLINYIIHTRLSEVSNEVQLETNITVLKISHDSVVEEYINTVSVLAYFISGNNYDRDMVENKILNLASDEWVIGMSRGNNSELILTPTIVGTEFLSIIGDLRKSTASESITIDEMSLFSIPNVTKKMMNCTMFSVTSPVNLIFNETKLYRTFKNIPRLHHTSLDVIDMLIDVTHSLTCPFVSVNVTDKNYKDNIVIFIFSFNGRNITVPSSSNISLVKGELLVCLDLFKNLTRIVQIPKDDILTVVGIYLEFVCVFLSVICLLISFVTYCLFPSLRTLPGLNNMCLSISLAVAQTLLLITVQFGVPGKLHQGYCLFHAIVLHYSWLSTFMWMSACCIHMYKVFTNHSAKYISTKPDTELHVKYCLYAFGSPVIIIVLLIVVCAWITQGTSIGYSNKFCFLDIELSILTTILSLIVPLCCTIFINGVLFFLTVREIVFVSSLQRHKKDGQSVITYAKLSSLTGIFYIVGGVAFQVQNPILDFITSPLLCLQGVFIFMSFIFNKRVGRMYSNLLGYNDKSSVDSSSNKKILHTSNATTRKTVRSDTDSSSI